MKVFYLLGKKSLRLKYMLVMPGIAHLEYWLRSSTSTKLLTCFQNYYRGLSEM